MPPVCVDGMARCLAADVPQAARAWMHAQFSPAWQGRQRQQVGASAQYGSWLLLPIMTTQAVCQAAMTTTRLLLHFDALICCLTRKHGVLSDGAHRLGGARNQVAHAATRKDGREWGER